MPKPLPLRSERFNPPIEQGCVVADYFRGFVSAAIVNEYDLHFLFGVVLA
jgi:hypothetical protein